MNVVDASVAVKWFVAEPQHTEALALLESGATLLAPDLILVEVVNVLRRKFKRGELTEAHWREAVVILPKYFDSLVPSAELIATAVSIAIKLDHPVYDCLYLAVAASSAHALVTADQVLVDKCQRAGLGNMVMALDVWHRARQRTMSDATAIHKVLDLYGRFETTLDFVTDFVSTPAGEGRFRLTQSEDLKPAFDPPTYLNLKSLILGMNRHERAELLALGWLGQGYSGDDWPAINRRAEDYLTDDPELHVAYLISKICHIESGLAKRKIQQAAAELDDPPDEA